MGRLRLVGRVLVAVGSAVLCLAPLSGCSLVQHDKNGGKSVSVFDVKPGECFTPQKQVAAELATLTEVPCTDRHTQESYAIVAYDSTANPTTATATAVPGSDTYPGESALEAFANGACAQRYTGYVGTDYLDSRLFFTFLLPSARSWQDKDRNVICFVTTTGQDLTKSVKGSKL